jgi:hypothetical protein
MADKTTFFRKHNFVFKNLDLYCASVYSVSTKARKAVVQDWLEWLSRFKGPDPRLGATLHPYITVTCSI